MTDIVERAKTCGADGDAMYCWSVAMEVADECISLRQQLAEYEGLDASLAVRQMKAIAESQAREKVLRDALESCSLSKSELRKQALALPHDSAALDEAIRQAEKRVEASYKVELDLLREIGEILEPVDYRGSYAVGIKEAIRQAKKEALLELSDMIYALNACEQAVEIRRMADGMK